MHHFKAVKLETERHRGWPMQLRKVWTRRRDYLKKKAVKTNSTACHNAYKSVRNEINKKIMYAKRIIRQTVLTETEIMQ
jgi:hypothetical protein